MRKSALRSSTLTAASILSAVCSAHAQAVLYSENFNTTTGSDWTVNANAVGTNTGFDRATFLFDYSSVGIPAAPNSAGTTLGLRLQANRLGSPSNALTGISVSPTGQSFTGDYQLRYDSWQNFQAGPAVGASINAGGNGTTQVTGAGIMTAGTVAHFAGAGDGLWFAATGDGGSGSDYRIYNKGVNQSTLSMYAAGSQNNTAAYYSGLGAKNAPAAQLAAFPEQVGTTQAGTMGFAWHDVTVTKTGNIVTWDVDGLRIGTIDITSLPAFGGNNILFAQADINNTASTDASSEQLLFGLIDNVRVTAVPEPSTYALMGTGALLFLSRARRQRK